MRRMLVFFVVFFHGRFLIPGSTQMDNEGEIKAYLRWIMKEKTVVQVDILYLLCFIVLQLSYFRKQINNQKM